VSVMRRSFLHPLFYLDRSLPHFRLSRLSSADGDPSASSSRMVLPRRQPSSRGDVYVLSPNSQRSSTRSLYPGSSPRPHPGKGPSPPSSSCSTKLRTSWLGSCSFILLLGMGEDREPRSGFRTPDRQSDHSFFLLLPTKPTHRPSDRRGALFSFLVMSNRPSPLYPSEKLAFGRSCSTLCFFP